MDETNKEESFMMGVLKHSSFIEKRKDRHAMKIDEMVSALMSLYPKKIYSLFEENKKTGNDVYVMMILNCDEKFHKKYVKSLTAERISINAVPMPIDSSCDEAELRSENSKENIKVTYSDDKKNKNVPLEAIYMAMMETQKFTNLIKEILSEISKSNETLIDTFLDRYARDKSDQLRYEYPEYYDKCYQIYSSYNKSNTSSGMRLNSMSMSSEDSYAASSDKENIWDFYTEFEYEDYIIILCRFIRYFTELTINIELNDEEKKVMLRIFGDDSVYEKIAKFFGYELQLKPYAYKYDFYMKSFKNKKEKRNDSNTAINNVDDSNMDLSFNYTESLLSSSSSSKKRLLYPLRQFRNLDINNPLHFPPYRPYDTNRKDKFRLYEHSDEYHDCNNDPDFSNETCSHPVSIFRNIDKLRLITRAMEQVFKLSTLEKVGLLNMLVYKRNYSSYGDKLSVDYLLHNNTKMCVTKNTNEIINTVRNFYGEHIAFYFLWVSSFCKWMIIPSIIGVILFIIIIQEPMSLDGTVETIKKLTLDYYDISLIISCVLNTMWATVFLKAWKQKEKMFRFIWGMENYEKNEPTDAAFKPNKTMKFCFGATINTVTTTSYMFRKTISFLILAVILLIRVSIVYYTFSLKAEGEQSIERNIIVASISGVIIKIMSIIYEYCARALSKWENYEKYSQQQNALAFKLILFEFVNNYGNLYYIAFIKPMRKESCLYSNCFKELEIQLYILLLINFSFNLYEIGYPLIRLKLRLRSYKKHNALTPMIHSVHYQLNCEGYKTLIYEYNERLISFGFVVLFSVAAPLTPFFVCILTYLENYVDLYKIFNLLRVELIEGSSGIEIYNFVFKGIYFIGMLTSTALILFSNKHIVDIKEYADPNLLKNTDFISKFLIFAIVENVILVINKVNLHSEPNWFQHLEELKSIYYKKYYNRDKKNLPHLSMEKFSEESKYYIDNKKNI